jgi:hypothetical protein
MKLLATAIFAGMLAFGTAVYAKEEPKKEVPKAAEVKKDAAPAPATKQVCLDVQGKDGKPVIDPKTKKPKQNCTTVKVREKFEGTKIPEGTKK